ncbi:hypothetical protein, partial [Klebsiella pneumoniae]|uniref:hypothetical protein n=1 Tax=Klebsiella pneumoniae TaxID=573 RepID=UPI0021C2E174
AVTEAVRTGPTLADLAPVSLAVAAWAGATRAAPVPVAVLVALGLTSAAVAWVGGRPRMQVVLAGLALAALTSLLGARSLAGLDPRTTGDVEATVALVTDPEPTPTGRVRVEVRLDGQRLMAEARAPAAIEAL